ncbi:hypothetical protein HDU98_003899 [Podochytrium sp. JEL0797]|nr:hypothetical protein HDU98_003899 [Podochytrium sp. JEL0797]
MPFSFAAHCDLRRTKQRQAANDAEPEHQRLPSKETSAQKLEPNLLQISSLPPPATSAPTGPSRHEMQLQLLLSMQQALRKNRQSDTASIASSRSSIEEAHSESHLPVPQQPVFSHQPQAPPPQPFFSRMHDQWKSFSSFHHQAQLIPQQHHPLIPQQQQFDLQHQYNLQQQQMQFQLHQLQVEQQQQQFFQQLDLLVQSPDFTESSTVNDTEFDVAEYINLMDD